jgi:GGDEF domain-containing protein
LDTVFLAEHSQSPHHGEHRVATHSNDSKDPEDLIKKADKAMYMAKEQGRNNYRFQTVALN